MAVVSTGPEGSTCSHPFYESDAPFPESVARLTPEPRVRQLLYTAKARVTSTIRGEHRR